MGISVVDVAICAAPLSQREYQSRAGEIQQAPANEHSLPRLCHFGGLFNSPENRAAHRGKNARVAEPTRTPIRCHRERLNFERQLPSVGFLGVSPAD
jgi:hypothetical protein